MSADIFNIVNFPADCGGCGHYRIMFPYWAVRTVRRDVRFVESMKLIADPSFFHDIRAIQVQRQVNDAQAHYFLNFLVPCAKQYGQWLIYSVDDVIAYEDIPLYNHGRKAYNNQKFFENVKNMLDATDFLTVTTDNLKEYYHNKYGIDNEKIIVIPNYLPRWWVGETYSVSRQSTQFNEYRKKPRIGLPLSSSHYDLTGQNNYQDDISHITDFIRSTCNKYQWCFIGHCPKQLEDLARNKKIEIQMGSDLLNYPRELWRRNFQAIVAPLQNNVFNRCKSNIKLIESWALGIPAIVQDLDPYRPYTDMLFKDANDLQNQLDRLFRDQKRYTKIIKQNRHIVDYGDKNSPDGWWIEKNLMPWMKLFTLPQKTIKIDLTKDGTKLLDHEAPKDNGLQLSL